MASSIDMVQLECGKCGIAYWVPKHFHNDRQKTKETFYCPNGDPRAFVESKADILQRKLDQQIQLREQAERSERVERGLRRNAEIQATRAKNALERAKKAHA